MRRFWGTVVEPIFEILQPKIVVEIGSDKGGNTENLLEFCKRSGATLHAIDPVPKYDVHEWEEQYGEHLVFHKDLSLNALPEIEDPDVVLIDGDHNWYTVFNELKLIEKTCEKRSQNFPLIFLHDIGWPYGRRDLYYDPDTIPPEHRKPYEKKGMRPGVPDLIEEGGINRHLYNATREYEPKSGVLTAVEDFLNQTERDLDLITLPGTHGLGIIIPLQLRNQSQKLAKFLQELDFSPFVMRYVEQLEEGRLKIQIGQQEKQQRLKQQILEERQRYKKERRKKRETKRDLQTLIHWMETIDEEIPSLLQSRSQRFGRALERIKQKSLRTPGRQPALERLDAVLKQFRAWNTKTKETPNNNGRKPAN